MPFEIEKILIIEDSKSQALLLQAILESNNLNSDIAFNGEEALKQIKETHYSLILLDMILPDTNGKILLQHFKNQTDTKQIPIIIITSSKEKEMVIDCLSIGACDYITKPYHHNELLMRVKLHLEINSSRRDIEKLNEELQKYTKYLDLLLKQKSNELKLYQDAINLNTISVVTNTEGVITFYNEPFSRLTNCNEIEIIGKNLIKFNAISQPSFFYKKIYINLKNKKSFRYEFKCKSKDNTFFWVDMVIMPIIDHDDLINSYFILALPITDRKIMEEERNRNLHILQSIAFKTSHDVRRPITSILGLANLIETDSITEMDLIQIAHYFKVAAQELDLSTKELTQYINENKA